MKSIYRIEGLTTRRGLGMGAYGISISIDKELAFKLYQFKRDENVPLIQMMKAELNHKYGRIEFVDDSWLLRLIMIESMSCSCFGLSGNVLESIKDKTLIQDLTWSPHNIDCPEQASRILSIWLIWFNNICCIEDGGKPLVEFPFGY